MLGQLYRLLGGVGAGAGYYRNTPLRLLHHDLDHPVMFLVVERRRLTGGTAWHDGIGAVGDLKLNQLPQPLFIDGVI